MRVWPLLLLLVGCSGLAKPEDDGYPVEISVESDPQRPLSGIEITRQGGTKALGTTGPQGKAKFILHGNVGEVVTVDVKCPTDFLPAKSIGVKLQRFASRKPVEHRATCTPLRRKAVFAVVADAAPGAFHKDKAVPLSGLRVKIFGVEQGITDDSGTVHLLVDANPDELVKLTVEAPEGYARKLTPPALAFDVRIEPRDTIYPVAATFHAQKEPTKPRPVGPVQVRPRGPQRI